MQNNFYLRFGIWPTVPCPSLIVSELVYKAFNLSILSFESRECMLYIILFR